MTPQDFDFLSSLLKQESGLILAKEKEYLLESRLAPVIKQNNISNMNFLVRELKKSGQANLTAQVVEAMTINESFFFRDKVPFDNFKNYMLPELIKINGAAKRIRIWSAAASTGQEAYSMSMILDDQKATIPNWKVEIIGTDLSKEVLEKAKSGLYSQFEVQRGMPVNYLMKYFKQIGSLWQIDQKFISAVNFQQLNLLKNFSHLGQFDIIFCRNVLIYFDRETKQDILKRLAKQCRPHGFLVLGASETLVGLSDDFKAVRNLKGLYQLNRVQNKPMPTTAPSVMCK